MQKIFILISILVFSTELSISQNIFDYNHSLKYASALKEDKYYEEAIEELLIIKEAGITDTNYVKLFLSIIGKQSKYESSIYLRSFLPFSKNEDVFNLIACNGLLIDSFSIVNEALKYKDSTSQFYTDFYLGNLLLQKEYDSVKKYLINEKIEYNNKQLILNSLDIKKKNKSVGVILSAIVPGLGKAYYNQYIDGVTALFTTTTYGYLTYSTLKNNGTNNIFPWINAAAFGLFYFGNIVGTANTHERYYSKVDLKIRNIIIPEIEKIYSTY